MRGVLLHVGLIVSLALVISAFKWKIRKKPVRVLPPVELSDDGIFVEKIHVTEFKSKATPRPEKVKPVIQFPTEFKELNYSPEENQTTVGIDQDLVTPMSIGPIDITEELMPPDTFRVVEKMPEPVGGWSAFYNTLRKNIKYPRQAQRLRASGKVFVEFTVNERGELSHFKIIKGIGYGCDEEAKRIIALTKWSPGKQRGKPVNVKMVQPVVFALDH